MKKAQLLNEIMGVPKVLDFWVDYFSYILAGMAKGIVSKDEIEESEITLMKDYFDNKSNNNNITCNINSNNKEIIENKKIKPKISKQKENELKQKELSIKLKNKKKAEKKHSEAFGEFIYDEYDKYDSKFD